MFTDKELQATMDYCERKREDILEKPNDKFTASDFRDLDTLAQINEAARKRLQRQQVD